MKACLARRLLVTTVVLAAGVLAAGLVLAGRSWPDGSGDLEPADGDHSASLEGEKEAARAMPLRKASHRRVTLPEGATLGWPTLLGPMHDGTSPERGIQLDWPETGPIEKWRAAVGTGYAGPVLLGDALVLLHRKEDREVVECFDAETGASRWQASWTTTYHGSHCYSNGPYSAPVLESDRVYAVGAEGEACCLRIDNGEVLWRRSLHKEYHVKVEIWPVAASPLIEGDRLILNLGAKEEGAGVVALDKATGQTLWTATSDGASCSTARAATIHGVRHVFVWTAEALVALDPADGAVRWRIPFAANNREAAHGTAPLVAGDVVLVSGYQIGNLCVRVLPDGSYQELWRDKRKLLDSQYNNLLHLDGNVCGFSSTRKSLRCLDLLTGELQWQWRSARIPAGTMIAVDGGCLVLSERGHLASLTLDPRGVTVRALTDRPVIAARAMSYPALHNGLLYVRNEEELLCIDLRRAEGTE